MNDLLRKTFTTKRIIIGSFSLIAVFSIVKILDQALMPWYTKHGEALTVPNVTAKRYETAKEILEVTELEAVKGGEMYDSNMPFGYVIEQNPGPNRLVKKGRRVYLTISVGEKEIQVPDLVGKSENNAKEIIKSYGLRLGEVEYEYVINEPPDVVIEQSQQPKSLVKLNSEIDLTVSLGEPKEDATMPSVLAKTLELAIRELKKAGVTIGEVSYKISSQYLPNTVIDQSIEPGTVVKHGAKVNLVVTVITMPEQQQ